MERFEDIDLKDNGVLPWLKGEAVARSGDTGDKSTLSYKPIQSAPAVAASTSAVADMRAGRQATPSGRSKELSSSPKCEQEELFCTIIPPCLDFKGVVLSDFEKMETDEHSWWGLVYAKDLRTEVSVVVSGVPSGAELVLMESSMIEMRGVHKTRGSSCFAFLNINVVFQVISTTGTSSTRKLLLSASC